MAPPAVGVVRITVGERVVGCVKGLDRWWVSPAKDHGGMVASAWSKFALRCLTSSHACEQ